MKKDKYAHITDEALKERLQKLDEGQGWTDTDPLYRRLQQLNTDIVNGLASADTKAAAGLRNLMPLHWARKSQQMRLKRELTTELKRMIKWQTWRTGYAHECIDDLEKLQGKFKEWQVEVQEMLDAEISL